VISGLALETPGVYHVAGPFDASVRSPDALDETGFVGVCWRGPVHTPVPVASWSQFVDVFGSATAPDGRSCPGHLPVAVRTFFDQGGRIAWVVRVAPVQEADDAAASVLIPRVGVELVAASEGTWGAWLSATLSFDVGPPLSGLTVARADDDEIAVTVSLDTVVPPGSLLLAGRTPTHPRGGLLWLRSQHVVAAQGPGRTRVLSLEPAAGFRLARPAGDIATLRIVTATLQAIDRDPSRRRSEVVTGLGLHPDHPRRVERALREESLLVRAGGGWDRPLLPPDAALASLGSVAGAPGRDRFAEIDQRSLFDDDTPDGDVLDERTDHRGVDAVGRVRTLGLVCVPDLTWSGHRFADGLPAHLDPRVAADLDEVVRRQAALVAVADLRARFVALIDAPARLPAGELTRWRSNFGSSFAAAYHPWLGVPAADPRDPAVPVPPSAFAAGIISARERRLGLAFGPANEVAAGAVVGLDRVALDAVGPLHRAGINVFHAERDGFRLASARTLSRDPHYEQLAVRRLMTMIMETARRHADSLVFEPHTPDLRGLLVHTLTEFLRDLFRRGALAGDTEESSFFVRCDESLNPTDAVAGGRLVAEIGVAPAVPLEFIVVRISQDAEGRTDVVPVTAGGGS
jgi:hypothetical protein